jgi:hypothetical protein
MEIIIGLDKCMKIRETMNVYRRECINPTRANSNY